MTHADEHRFGPRPRPRNTRGDWLLLLTCVVIWGISTGSPLMRPKQAQAQYLPTTPAVLPALVAPDSAEHATRRIAAAEKH